LMQRYVPVSIAFLLLTPALFSFAACARMKSSDSSERSLASAPAPMATSADEAKESSGKSDEKHKGKDGDEKPGPKTWKRAGSATHAARVSIGDKEQLPVRAMQVKVQVDGPRARVVVDAYFENDRGSQYEGTFQLRLPDGATPYFFAFGETQWEKPA